MPLSDYPKIQKLINQGYEFRFFEYFEEGFNLFKKGLWSFFGYTAVYFFMIYLMSRAFVALIITTKSLPMILLISILIMALITMLSAGYAIFADKLYRNQSPQFDDFFKGFEFTKELLLRVLVSSAISVIVSIPLYYLQWEAGYFDWLSAVLEDFTDLEVLENEPELSSASYFLQIPSWYFFVSYIWADYFIIFKKMNFWDAMEASRQLIADKWFLFLGFLICLFLVAGVGLVALCFGVLLTVPLSLVIIYLSFADVVGATENAEDKNDLLDHLIDEV